MLLDWICEVRKRETKELPTFLVEGLGKWGWFYWAREEERKSILRRKGDEKLRLGHEKACLLAIQGVISIGGWIYESGPETQIWKSLAFRRPTESWQQKESPRDRNRTEPRGKTKLSCWADQEGPAKETEKVWSRRKIRKSHLRSQKEVFQGGRGNVSETPLQQGQEMPANGFGKWSLLTKAILVQWWGQKLRIDWAANVSEKQTHCKRLSQKVESIYVWCQRGDFFFLEDEKCSLTQILICILTISPGDSYTH